MDDFRFSAPGGAGSGDARDKLTEQLAAVAMLNEAIRTEAAGTNSRTDNLADKLKRWLDDLLDNLQVITSRLPEVATYAVTVSLPTGVGVTVTFKKPDR